jgi:hypothetical protein
VRNGSWQHMTRADWERAGGYMMGNGWMLGTGGGWSTGAVIGVVLAAVLLTGLAVAAVSRRPWRGGPSQPRTA